MTVFIQVLYPGDRFHVDQFRPWIKCKDRQETVLLAAHKALRDAGYMNHACERQTLELTVYSYTDQDPKHPSGRPMVVHRHDVHCTPRDA
ncbi:MAG: hypothetical protein ACOY3P_20275 [Planctomycetota bacterium]